MNNEVINVQAKTPETIAVEIKTIQRTTQHIMLKAAVEIGQRLHEAKELVDHGEWIDYIEKTVEFSQSTANKYMQLSTEYGDISNSELITNLGYTNALKLLAIPEGEREEFAEEVQADKISASDLQAEIDEYKSKNKELDKQIKSSKSENKKLENELKEKNKVITDLGKAADSSDEAVNKKVADELAKKEEELKAEINGELESAKNEAAAAIERATLAEKQAEQSKNDAIVTFKVLSNHFQETFNELLQTIEEVQSANPDQAEKMKNALSVILGGLSERL